MNATSRAMLCALVASVLCAGALLAGAEGRISGRVLDASGDPLQGVEVVLVSPQTGGEQSKTTDKKGKVVFLVLDATARYAVRITKEGYQPIQERIRPVVGSTLRKEWRLVPAAPSGGGGGGVGVGGEVRGKAGAIRLYNAGATASNEGDRATAIEKFREAIEVDPGFVPGHQALLGLYVQERTRDPPTHWRSPRSCSTLPPPTSWPSGLATTRWSSFSGARRPRPRSRG